MKINNIIMNARIQTNNPKVIKPILVVVSRSSTTSDKTEGKSSAYHIQL